VSEVETSARRSGGREGWKPVPGRKERRLDFAEWKGGEVKNRRKDALAREKGEKSKSESAGLSDFHACNWNQKGERTTVRHPGTTLTNRKEKKG